MTVIISCAFGQTNLKKDAKNLYKLTYAALISNDSVSYKNLFLPDTSKIDCASKMYEDFIIYPSFKEIKDHLKEVIDNNIKAREFEIFDYSHLDTLTNSKKPIYVKVYSLEIKFFLDKIRMRSLTFSMSYYKDKLVYLTPPSYGYTIDE